jgi:hypothetical protein
VCRLGELAFTTELLLIEHAAKPGGLSGADFAGQGVRLAKQIAAARRPAVFNAERRAYNGDYLYGTTHAQDILGEICLPAAARAPKDSLPADAGTSRATIEVAP